MRQLVLEKIVISAFPPVNKRCLWLKGNTFYYWYKGVWRSINSNIDVNEDYIDEKVSETVAQEMDSILGGAPEEFNTLGEIADYITQHEKEVDEIQENVSTNKESIEDLDERLDSIDPSGSGWTDVS